MNTLSLDIGTEADSEKPTLLLYIDGNEFREILLDNSNAVFFYNLVESLNGTGEYLIFTCVCGVADCGGWDKVKVTHNDNKIIWVFSFNEKQHIFIFSLDIYKNEIYKMQERIDTKKTILQPQFATDPE
ncbi:MAG: hypothetical protein H0W73_19685 [Bacteroidetes bacterium]|nr:hypothetical protein [Bacteroidota bacterium]